MCMIDIIKRYCTKKSDVNDYVIENKLIGYECIICLESLDEGQKVSLIKCEHIYHTECLNIWFLKKKTCPLCNDKLNI